MPVTYLDASAIVKLAIQEPESAALRRYLRRRRPVMSSALARTEVLRALPAGDHAVARGRDVLARLDLIRVNDRVLNAAGAMESLELRPLDAIHLASAEQLGTELGPLVTYDVRLADAAKQRGHRVATPH